MLYIYIVLLEALVCIHVIGGAVLFRSFFPRESPWLGFFLPMLGLVSLLNFIEHFVALPTFSWLVSLSTGAMIWAIVRLPQARKKLFLPSILFVGLFTFALALRAVEPDIDFHYTEGLTDLTRILDFCEGDTLPPVDSWLPPYDHAGYYSFMHYGVSVLKRLFSVNIGTSYNLGFAFLNALTLLVVGAAAHSLSRYRSWIAVLVVFVAAGGFTGSTAIDSVLHPLNLLPSGSINIGDGRFNIPVHNEFAWLLKRSPPSTWYRLYTPGCYLYFPEFHATLGGHFLTLFTVFAGIEVLRRKRTVFPWIYLLVAPFLIYITCPWFLFVAGFLAWPTLLLAWWVGRRPAQWKFVAWGAAIWTALLLPTVISFKLASISGISYGETA